jgi:hypothetical protein
VGEGDGVADGEAVGTAGVCPGVPRGAVDGPGCGLTVVDGAPRAPWVACVPSPARRRPPEIAGGRPDMAPGGLFCDGRSPVAGRWTTLVDKGVHSATATAMDRMITIDGTAVKGCRRTTATAFPVCVRTQSAIRARATPAAGSLGHFPMRALLRTRSRAARR